MIKTLLACATAFALAAPALAQAPVPAPAAKTTMSTTTTTTKSTQTATNPCTIEANKQGLHGKAKKAFKSKCHAEAKAGAAPKM